MKLECPYCRGFPERVPSFDRFRKVNDVNIDLQNEYLQKFEE